MDHHHWVWVEEKGGVRVDLRGSVGVRTTTIITTTAVFEVGKWNEGKEKGWMGGVLD